MMELVCTFTANFIVVMVLFYTIRRVTCSINSTSIYSALS